MDLKSRITHLERRMKINDGYCPCGTPCIDLNESDGKLIINDICPQCLRPVRKLTFAEIAKAAESEMIKTPKNELSEPS